MFNKNSVRITTSAVLLIIAVMTGFYGCAPTVPEVAEEPVVVEAKAPQVTVTVAEENLRAMPNGEKVGVAKSGEKFDLIERRANWAKIDHPQYDSAWIWAPSLGLAKINAMIPYNWLGNKSKVTIDTLVAHFGPCSKSEAVSPGFEKWTWQNFQKGGGTLLGSSKFRSIDVVVDKQFGNVVSLDINLPPFEGDLADIMKQVGMKKQKAAKSDFDMVLYKDQIPGLYIVQFNRVKGDFKKFDSIHVEKYNQELWRNGINITNRKAVTEGKFEIILEMENVNSNMVFANPVIEAEIVDNGKSLGKWKLGPAHMRYFPGDKGEVSFDVPLDPSSVNPNSIGLSADLIDMIVVPQ